MSKKDNLSLDTQILLLKQVKQTKDIKDQIHKLEMTKEFGDSYDPDTDWWPNKYPDM
jgi:hypothetical protein